MPLDEIVAITGIAVQGTLALLLLLVWRALRARWTLVLSAGFLMVVAQYACVAAGHYTVNSKWSDPPAMPNALFALVAHGLITWALISYVAPPEAWGKPLRQATLLAFGVALIALGCGVLTRGETIAAIGAFMCGWAALFGWAAHREPWAGHGFVMLAVLVYPLAMLSALAGWLSVSLAGISLIVPHAVLGMTILTTGLVRAQASSLRELAARQEIQAELERTNQTLELRVALRTAQLRETIEGLESFNRSVSHDLRGPLGGIAGLAGIARAKLAEGRADEAQTMLAAIERQAEESVAMVAAMLQLARAGTVQPQRAEVDTTALAGEVVAALEASGKTASTQVVVQPLPAAHADRELLRQVFANLVGNACKFADGRHAAQVEVGHADTARGQAYFVRDNGIGFAPADAGRLFRPFERLNGQRFEGAGVGLSIVKRIIDHHGGRVWAEGAPGAGATFWFTLGS